MASRRTFLHNAAAVGAGVLLAQASTSHAADEPGYVDRLTDADSKPLPAPGRGSLYAISIGLSRTIADDHEQLRCGMLLYDALYAWCKYDART